MAYQSPKTITLEDFNAWLKSGRTGSVCKYHTGFLAVDRFHIVDVGAGEFRYDPVPELDALGRAALNAFVEEKVHLYQRKIHDMEYEYYAVKANRRNW